MTQGAFVQVGMDEAQPLEATPGATLTWELRNKESLGIPHDDVGNDSGTINEDSHLAMYFPRNFGELPG